MLLQTSQQRLNVKPTPLLGASRTLDRELDQRAGGRAPRRDQHDDLVVFVGEPEAEVVGRALGFPKCQGRSIPSGPEALQSPTLFVLSKRRESSTESPPSKVEVTNRLGG